MPDYRIIEGDVRERLCDLPDESVQTCVTSPPYWGLRDYGVDGQLGLEPTPEEYVANLVAVFREVKRVLRDDGTLWLNLGDSYAGSTMSGGGKSSSTLGGTHHEEREGARFASAPRLTPGLKPKDLVGIPWAVAFALRADGWYLRSDIIWAKPNPMPESVRDRPTKAHEYLFLLSKGRRYFYDADAIREEAIRAGETVTLGSKSLSVGQATGMNRKPSGNGKAESVVVASGRNKRSVWTVATQPFRGAHFATFPPKLIEPCILAGSRPHGAMIEPEVIATPLAPEGERSDPTPNTGRKGMNRKRVNGEGTRPITVAEQRAYAEQLRNSPHRGAMEGEAGTAFAHYLRTDNSGARPIPPDLLTRWIDRGWLTAVEAPEAVPADPSTSVVLDPFAGAGTTGVVALRHNRSFVGIELNPEYAQMARDRIRPVVEQRGAA